MSWSPPKTDWDTDDAIATTDLTRIEGNALYLHPKKGTDVASATNLDIGSEEDFYVVTGDNDIHFIKINGRATGERIYLAFNEALTIESDYGVPPTGYAAPTFSVDPFTTNPNTILCFLYDGTYWRNV